MVAALYRRRVFVEVTRRSMVTDRPLQTSLAFHDVHPKIAAMKGELPTQAAWTNVSHGWQRLYGSFEEMGICIEWHDFTTSQPLDWAESFRPRSIEFCLNLDGRGAIGRGNATPRLRPEQLRAIMRSATSRSAPRGRRTIIIALSRSNIRESICKSSLRPPKAISRRPCAK